MELERIYPEEVRILKDIVKRNEELIEEDIKGAFKLQKDALQAYYRWSNIKYYTKKDLIRGQSVALKERLEEICLYLKNVHISSNTTWLKAREDLRGI